MTSNNNAAVASKTPETAVAKPAVKALPRLAPLPRLRTKVPCECGCGTPCGNRFAPGHDARLLGFRKRVERGTWTLDFIATEYSEGEARATAKALGVKWEPTKEVKTA